MIVRDAAIRIVVMASGNGSNFEALATAIASGKVDAVIPALVTDRPDAACVRRARTLGIEVVGMSPMGRPREVYDASLADAVERYRPDWVFLLGWMRILSMAFVSRFPGRVVNLHPALPRMFPGVDSISRAREAALRGEITVTGVMIHLVPDEGVDSGPALAVEEIPIHTGESHATLERRVHEVEHRLVIEVAMRIARQHGRNSSSITTLLGAP